MSEPTPRRVGGVSNWQQRVVEQIMSMPEGSRFVINIPRRSGLGWAARTFAELAGVYVVCTGHGEDEVTDEEATP